MYYACIAASVSAMEVDNKEGAGESKSVDTSDTDDLKKTLEQKKVKLTPSGYLITLSAVIELEIGLGYLDRVKLLIDEAVEVLSSINSAEPLVYASVYHAKAEYHKKVGPASDYYNTALQYLAYTPVEALKGKKAVELAIDLSLAALVGENIYNFGEVLTSPIISALQGTEFAWLCTLMKACNNGDINAFNTSASEHAKEFATQPALASSVDTVKQKVALLAFVELVFHRPATKRVVSFVDIAQATCLPLDQVEWLLMKAMSIGLIRGSINELEKIINVTWVQPRVLDVGQMESIRTKLTDWSKTAHSTLLYVEDNLGDLLN